MMKKNSGFVFIETVMVTVVLSIVLIACLVAFNKLLAEEKRRLMYDDTSYIYTTYHIENFIVSLNIEKYIKEYMLQEDSKTEYKRKIVEFNCSDRTLYDLVNNGEIDPKEEQKMNFCTNVINSDALNIKHIYITTYDINSIKDCLDDNGNVVCDTADMEVLDNLSINAIYYLRTLYGSNKDPDNPDYRVIVEYEEEVNNCKVTKNPVNGSCPSNYNMVNSKCCKKDLKNYYSNIKLVIRGTYL